MVEHLVCNQAVVGSSPVASTIVATPLTLAGDGTHRAIALRAATWLFEN